MGLLLLLATFSAQTPAPPKAAPAAVDSFQPDPSWKPLGRSLWFDPKTRQLILRARVVLVEGPLEHLLCLKGTKEHEAILATDAVPQKIHAGLLLTGAEPGHPVRFQPKFEPPSGSPINIELEWTEGGKSHRANAREWIKAERTNKTLDRDWVFAGSELFEDPTTKKPVYAADDGDLITVANFANAILDLPFASTSAGTELLFVANTKVLPPRGTFVTLYLRPRPAPAQPK
jgi:hypothetical protein